MARFAQCSATYMGSGFRESIACARSHTLSANDAGPASKTTLRAALAQVGVAAGELVSGSSH